MYFGDDFGKFSQWKNCLLPQKQITTKKNVSGETVKLNPHEICKILQVKQSTISSPCKKVVCSVLQRSNSEVVL